MKHLTRCMLACVIAYGLCGCRESENGSVPATSSPPEVSGIYPHLAFYNQEDECGTGAVVPWADRLWVVTYGPHLPYGSSDKLYEITTDLNRITRSESIGGTPANRMIHKESDQLFIGPYAITADRTVRTIPYTRMPGRLTGNARHLFQPEQKIYVATMEEGLYEVDVHSLEVRTLQPDAHELPETQYGQLLPGAHGKGLYSGQGVVVYTNNGESSPEALQHFDVESGALMEWDGSAWRLVRRNQFTEVTGPGGIYGNPAPSSDPIWTAGWDHKSLLLGVRESRTGQWMFYRLPKASHSYDGAHGWNTEWPRIRDIGEPGAPDFLMTMHGMFWSFPSGFSAEKSGGIRPRSAYLKVIGDFARWKEQIVFGCDDAAHREFLNTRKVKGEIAGPERSNSNLWFVEPDRLDQLGPSHAEGGCWLEERTGAGLPSEPFLFAGWDHRSCWIRNADTAPASFRFEVDVNGDGDWKPLKEIRLAPVSDTLVPFTASETGEWIRAVPGQSAQATLHFYYNETERRDTQPDPMFEGLSRISDTESAGGLILSLGDSLRALGLASGQFSEEGERKTWLYLLNKELQLTLSKDTVIENFIRTRVSIPTGVVAVDSASVLIVDDRNRRWRLPLGNEAHTELIRKGWERLSREVVTERDLFQCHGTFYELPAENADGFAKIRPVSSHPFRIHDFASYRGMLVMTGIAADYRGSNPHIIHAGDGTAAVWVGVIDDLWKLGKPTGRGGPWHHTEVSAGTVSDPYLIGCYDERTLELLHTSGDPVTFHLEADPVGGGPWMHYRTFRVERGERLRYRFPDEFQARWIRFRTDQSTTATAWLEYR